MRYCRHCGRMVRGTKRLGALTWLLIVLFSGATLGLFLFFFLLYFIFIKRHACPICGATDLMKSGPTNPAPTSS